MCFICGGPHYTKYCPNSSGNSTYDLPNSYYLQPQPYHNSYLLPHHQLCKEVEYPSCEGCGEPHRYEECPFAFRWSMPMIWDDDWDLNQGVNNESADTTELTSMETPMEDAEVTCENDEVEIEGQKVEVAEDPAREPELSYDESETKMDAFVPPPIQQKEQEEKDQENPRFIIDCTWNDDLIDQKLAEWKKSNDPDDDTERKESEEEFPDEEKPRFIIDFTRNDEEINEKLAEWKKLQAVDDEAEEEEELEEEIPDDPELSAVESETTTDNSVPPPVQQDPTLNWYSTPYSYGPEPIDDDFWSEDEKGVVEKMELEIPDYSTSPVVEEAEEEHPVDSTLLELETIMDDPVPPPPIDEDVLRNGDEKEEEEKFGEKLVNLPTLVDEEIFDPVGNRTKPEALMEGKPTMENKESPKEEVEEVVEEEEHHSWPVVMVGNEPHSASKLREKAKRKREPGGKRHLKNHGWFTKPKKKSLTCTRESSHYTCLIKFAPGKFDYWWPDPFKNFKLFCKSTKVNLFKTILDRAELNGLDRVQIKEKPPDEI